MQAIKKQRAGTDENKQIKRRRLLDAGRRLFWENGCQSTSIEMTTVAAGYGTGTFCTCFSSKMIRGFIILLSLAGILPGACTPRTHDNLNSILWMQTSAEYQAVALQAYLAAEERLDAALEDRSWTAAPEQTGDFSSLPPAVILDVDQTVLDNSPYNGELILQGAPHRPESWDDWVRLERAGAVPGAVRFVRAAAGKGVAAIYITNRKCMKRDAAGPECPQEQDTMDNLRQAGFPPVARENIHLRGEREDWDSEKSSRRAHAAESFRILMLIGDDLGDFIPGAGGGGDPARGTCVSDYPEMWGTRWFVLPNPVYGSWRRVLKEPVSECVRGYESPDGSTREGPER